MKRLWISALATSLSMASFAQDLTDSDLAEQILEDLANTNANAVPTNTLGKLVPSEYAQLRFLDRLNSAVEEFELKIGESAEKQYLNIKLESCYVPADDIASDAVAYLEIDDVREDQPDFRGWMIASSPALNALEHARYDVWVTSCTSEPKIQLTGEAQMPPNRPDFGDDFPSEFPRM